MLNNDAVTDGFKNRTPRGERNTYCGRKFSWMGSPEGRFAKIVIGILAEELRGNSVEVTRRFGGGVANRRIHERLVTFCPWLPEVYFLQRGVELTPSIVGQRWHKMFYDNSAPPELRGRRSPEHYLNHPDLRKYRDEVERLYETFVAVNLHTAREACS